MSNRPVVVDINNTPPHEVMRFLVVAITQLGSRMLTSVSEMKAERDGVSVEEVFTATSDNVHRIATEMSDFLQASVEQDEELGAVVLAALQAAVWEMQRFVEIADNYHGPDACGDACDDVESDDVENLADYVESDIQSGVLLRKKVRYDH